MVPWDGTHYIRCKMELIIKGTIPRVFGASCCTELQGNQDDVAEGECVGVRADPAY